MNKKTVLLVIGLIFKVTLFASQVDTIQVYSQSMNKNIETLVLSPTTNQGTPTPVLYLLHGFGNNAFGWVEVKPNLQELAEKYNITIVCSDAMNSWYWDSPRVDDSKYETFFSDELYRFIGSNYNVLTGRKNTAVAGLSMGGHGALWLASKYPSLYGAAGSMSGGVDLREFGGSWNLSEHLGTYSADNSLWSDYTVAANLERLASAKLALIIDCGLDDFFYNVNIELHSQLNKIKVPHDFIIRPGAHNRAYWNNAIEYQLLFFHQYFNSADQ